MLVFCLIERTNGIAMCLLPLGIAGDIAIVTIVWKWLL